MMVWLTLLSALLLSGHAATLEPPTTPASADQSAPPNDREAATEPTIIDSYTPDEAISEDNAIALPADI